jgi:hypothetical protein
MHKCCEELIAYFPILAGLGLPKRAESDRQSRKGGNTLATDYFLTAANSLVSNQEKKRLISCSPLYLLSNQS